MTLALPIATTLTCGGDGHLSSSLTGGNTSEIAGHVPFVLATGPEGLIVTVFPDRASELAARWRVRIYHAADSRCWPMSFREHPYVGSGNLGAPSILAPAPLGTDPRQGTSLCRDCVFSNLER